MLTRKTVLVLGAGSSVEFGLKDGKDLATIIARKVDFKEPAQAWDEPLFASLARSQPGGGSRYLAAGRIISGGLPLARSIDEFLYNHGENEDIVLTGKAAIASTIIEAEAASRLTKSNLRDFGRIQFHALRDTWLYRLFQFLWTDIRAGEAHRVFDNLYIINFNYDRCVEYFFRMALQYAYSLNEVDAAAIAGQLQIVHPYGQVGGLPWQDVDLPTIPFGGHGGQPDPVDLASSIKTFTEQAHDPEEVERWRAQLAAAQQIVFLGFGFHKQNVELLTGEARKSPSWPTGFATAFGASEADHAVFKARMDGIQGRPPNERSILSPEKCGDFISQYGLSLFT